MMKITLLTALIASTFLLSGTAEAAWVTTDLGNFGSSDVKVIGVNNAGQILGDYAMSGGRRRYVFDSNTGQVTTVGTLGGRNDAVAINASGQVAGVAGRANNQTAVYRYTNNAGNGQMVDLGRPSNNAPINAIAMNDAGQIAVNSNVSTNVIRAYVTAGNTGSGEMTDLGTLGGSYSKATAMNNAGQVVGESRLSNGNTRAFIYTGLAGSGQMTDLGTLGGNRSSASAINASGQVVGSSTLADGGTRAFLSTGHAGAGQMIDLGTLGGNMSMATAINDAGQVIGISYLENGPVNAFIYKDGQMIGLGTLGGSSSVASGINAAGHVVGYADTEVRGQDNPFFYDGATMFDVSELVTGFTSLSSNIFLNDVGQIAGTGLVNGKEHAFLLTYVPDASDVPEPASIALFTMGMLGFAVARRRRH